VRTPPLEDDLATVPAHDVDDLVDITVPEAPRHDEALRRLLVAQAAEGPQPEVLLVDLDPRPAP
jgi:hypothetical protein